ncbi:amidohydrolase family protein, partial [Chloroflexota bacterium]
MDHDYFIMDSEAHIWRPEAQEEVSYFRDFERHVRSSRGIIRPIAGEELIQIYRERPHLNTTFENLIADMDAGGVDMACVLPEKMEHISMGAAPWSTNGYCITAVQKYPDRLVLCPNFGPVIKRGVNEAIWEMEYMAKEQGAKIFKFYPPEDTYINDERLWPFYAKAQELGLVMSVHTGMGYMYADLTKYCHPLLLDDVCKDFYDLRIIAFHFGWPFHHELNALAAKYPNLYISMSYLLQAVKFRPRWVQELIGEAMLYATANKIIWGVDWPTAPMKFAVECFWDIQIDEDLQTGY